MATVDQEVPKPKAESVSYKKFLLIESGKGFLEINSDHTAVDFISFSVLQCEQANKQCTVSTEQQHETKNTKKQQINNIQHATLGIKVATIRM